jgi:membrane associated rhomboid family serine protease
MVVFGLQLLSAWKREPSLGTLFDAGGVLDAMRSGAMLSVPSLVALEPWRLLSACFVHFGLLHIGMNMLGLMHLCRLLEPAIGSVRLLLVYIVTGILGFAVSLAYYTLQRQPSPTAGASGAIFGLMGAVLGFLYRRDDERWKQWLIQTVGYSLMFGLLMRGVNNAAHLAGLVSGALLGWLFAPGAPSPSTLAQRLLATASAVAVVASLVLARLSDLPEILAGLR